MIYQTDNKQIYINKAENFDFVAHAHREIEIFICLSGEAKVSCNFKTEMLNPGNVMLAFPNEIHAYFKEPCGENILIIIDTAFLGNFSDLKNVKYENFLMGENERIVNLANELSNEYKTYKNPQIMLGYIYIILGDILRKLPVKDTLPNIPQNLLSNVLKYVSENYTRTLTLKSVSRNFGVSSEHLSRLFSKTVSCSFTEYLHLLRIEHSKKLLFSSDKSITEIASLSGFNDLRTFNRVFKTIVGITPSEYRKQ